MRFLRRLVHDVNEYSVYLWSWINPFKFMVFLLALPPGKVPQLRMALRRRGSWTLLWRITSCLAHLEMKSSKYLFGLLYLSTVKKPALRLKLFLSKAIHWIFKQIITINNGVTYCYDALLNKPCYDLLNFPSYSIILNICYYSK